METGAASDSVACSGDPFMLASLHLGKLWLADIHGGLSFSEEKQRGRGGKERDWEERRGRKCWSGYTNKNKIKLSKVKIKISNILL